MLELEAQTLYAVLIRLALAALMGGVIGLEREKARRSAGLRTHMLICLGAALIMCTGEYIFERYGGENNIDPARMGAQVVSGIGILCAGTIIKEGPTVRGLTTATGLWCASCIGIAVGSGNILPAAGATVIVLVILWLFRHIEERRLQKSNCIEFSITACHTQGVLAQIVELFMAHSCTLHSLSYERTMKDQLDITFTACLPRTCKPGELAAQLSAMQEILAVREQTSGEKGKQRKKVAIATFFRCSQEFRGKGPFACKIPVDGLFYEKTDPIFFLTNLER